MKGVRAVRWTVAVAFCAALLAPASAQATRIEPFATTAADGTALRGHVHIPDGEGPFATVLNLSPYWNGPAYLTSDQPTSPAQANAQFLLDAGFAVALVNMRGTGLSQGCTTFGSRAEWSDAAEVVQALAAKPWSNGRIGMHGISFDGWSQWMAVAEAPPALKAVVPASGVIDLWSLLTRRGAPILDSPVVPLQWWALTSLTSIPPDLSHFNCLAEQADNTVTALDLIGTGNRTPYLDARDMRAAIAGSDVPALVSNGMKHFDEGHVLQYEGLWDLLRPDRTHLVIGQWGHDFPTAYKPEWSRQVIGWFDQYLRDGPPTVPTGVVEYQDTSGAWHTADRWPPPSNHTTLRLNGKRLSPRPPGASPRQVFQSLPLVEPATLCGPGQAVYVSPPLAEDVLVAGNIGFDLKIASTLPGGNLVAVLRHTPGDGGCIDLARQRPEVGRVALDLRHWATPGRARSFPLLRTTPLSLRGHPGAALIPKGHRLVLGVGGGSLDLQPDPLLPLLTVGGGSLRIPVVEGALRFD